MSPEEANRLVRWPSVRDRIEVAMDPSAQMEAFRVKLVDIANLVELAMIRHTEEVRRLERRISTYENLIKPVLPTLIRAANKLAEDAEISLCRARAAASSEEG